MPYKDPIKQKEYIRFYRETHKEQTKKWQQDHKEHLKNYRKTRDDYYTPYYKNYLKNNPEKYFKSNLKQLIKNSSSVGKSFWQYNFAILTWSKLIKKRDEICNICASNSELEAHHIIHKKLYPKLSLNQNNGITLCHLCHQQSHGRKLLLNPFIKR